MHLLVIEDERALCETIVRDLRRLAYSVDFCHDGEEALELLYTEHYDLVLLDLNLPGKDGMTVLRTLRQTDHETRVLILSARSGVEDKVAGLDAGANDYLAKPFHLAELEARIRSLTLRQFTQQDVLLTCGDLHFDTRSRTAAVNGQPLTLTRKETGILEYLNEAGYKSEWVVVERNFEIIPRENLGNVTIQDNDEIEVLRFVGGG